MPSIQSTGGIFLRLDTSGNLNVYDTTGTSIAIFSGGLFAASANRAKGQIFASSTTSVTAVSSGSGLNITNKLTGRFLVLLIANLKNNTAGDGGAAQIFRNTTGIPTAGTAVGSDTGVGSAGLMISPVAGNTYAVNTFGIDTGLTAGTKYYYYCAINATNGGTVDTNTGGEIEAYEL